MLAARVGRAFSGGQGLALAMAVATVVLLPVGVVGGGGDLAAPGAARGRASRSPCSARRSPTRWSWRRCGGCQKGTFGVLMSLEPAVAALVGLVLLGQDLSATEVVAIALVVAASAGALGSARAPAPVEA